MKTNLDGSWLVAQEAARRLVAAKRPGSIINISSIYARRVSPGVVPYTVSKAGGKHLTKGLALAIARFVISGNGIAHVYNSPYINRASLYTKPGPGLAARVPSQ